MENEVKEAAPKYHHLTPGEYLEMERASEEKHEYYKGEVFAMSGASLEHNIIVKNINTHVLAFLKGKPCDMFGSDLRIHIPENTLFTYPDLSVICGNPQKADQDSDSIINPAVIIEVLSKTTRGYDRGGKFHLYRSIKTLNEFILIDSLNINVEIYTRKADDSWILKEFNKLTDSISIDTIKFSLLLKDLYENVFFDVK